MRKTERLIIQYCINVLFSGRNQIVGKRPFKTLSSVLGISIFVLIASQLIGNVAVIQLAKPNVEYLPDEDKRFAWARISFVATVGGNLIITGSAGMLLLIMPIVNVCAEVMTLLTFCF